MQSPAVRSCSIFVALSSSTHVFLTSRLADEGPSWSTLQPRITCRRAVMVRSPEDRRPLSPAVTQPADTHNMWKRWREHRRSSFWSRGSFISSCCYAICFLAGPGKFGGFPRAPFVREPTSQPVWRERELLWFISGGSLHPCCYFMTASVYCI